MECRIRTARILTNAATKYPKLFWPGLADLGRFNFWAVQVFENQHGVARKVAKETVVQTYPVPKTKKMSIMRSHHVFALPLNRKNHTARDWREFDPATGFA